MNRTVIQEPPTAASAKATLLDDFFWPIAFTLLAARVWLAASCELVPDEAFYWTWSRHLSFGYFDHPPMIAWLIWLSTRVFGINEATVRLPAALLSIGSLGIVVMLARRLLRDARAVGYVILIWIAGPLLPVVGTIHTPDSSAIFFSMAAMACAALAVQKEESAKRQSKWTSGAGLWLAFGLFSGLAVLSKYTAVLLPGSVALALFTSRSGRRCLRRPWVWLAAIVAVAVFSPVIYWNATHQWASFEFQLHHGAGGGLTEGVRGPVRIIAARGRGLGEFVGGQAVVWTPVLFGVSMVVLIGNWMFALRSTCCPINVSDKQAIQRLTWFEKMGGLRRPSDVDWLLLWCGTVPLLFFGWAATRSHGEINWPAFAYFPISILLGRYLTEFWAGYRVEWIKISCGVAFGFTVAVHLMAVPAVQRTIGRHVKLTHQVSDLWGWREFGRSVSQVADGLPVVTSRHQDAGELAFYMPGRPDVWCESHAVGSRWTAFDYFDHGRPDYALLPKLIFVGDRADIFMKKFGYARQVSVYNLRAYDLARPRIYQAVKVER